MYAFCEEVPISSTTFVWRKLENNTFSIGEKLSFNISWGPIAVGYAEMRVEGSEDFNGRKAYQIVSEASSYPFVDAFYKVRNRDVSWMDSESLCSLKYDRQQRESGYVKDETYIFDHINRRFELREKGKDGIEKVIQGEMPIYVHDVLSAFYYIRTLDLKVGKEYYLDTQTGDKNYPLRVVVYKKEKIKVPAGKFECFLIEPFIQEDAGMFKAKGRLWIWLTADEHKIPVLMKSKIFIGNITAELVDRKL